MINDNVYSADQFKTMDSTCGIDGSVLMKNAASNLYGVLEAKNKLKSNILIMCGKGNNGGDGYALAILLLNNGFSTTVCALEEPSSPLAAKFFTKYKAWGGTLINYNDINIDDYGVIVDCMFGFSFKGELKGIYADAVKSINESEAYVLACDLPSGLIADCDNLPKLAVKANATCTFTAYKTAQVSYPAREFCGEVYITDIGIQEDILGSHTPLCYTNGNAYFDKLPQRKENSHKGCYGPLSALCGNKDMSGAAILACSGALRTGTGLVRLYSHENTLNTIKTVLPEVIAQKAISNEQILSDTPKAILVGCGCGRTYDKIIKELLLCSMVPMIIDADGINCISDSIELCKSVKCPLILTPHPKEMSRLCGKTVEEINGNRINTAIEFSKEHGVITVLKGSSTVVASPDGKYYVNLSGNSGLAKGGSGDVLAGIIASLAAQGTAPFYAAVIGVYIHGKAAEVLAERKGVYAMLPSELAEEAGKILYFR